MLANALEKSKKYISKIISAMADSLIVTDDQGIIKTINPATTHLFGYSNSELVNSSIGLLFEDPQQLDLVHQKCLSCQESDWHRTAILIMTFDLPKPSNFERRHRLFKDRYCGYSQ